MKLVGKVAVQNGFLLLKQTSLEVLGGTVEALYKKWVSQKVMVVWQLLKVFYYLNLWWILLQLIVRNRQPGEE